MPGGTLEQGTWEVGLRTLGRIDATDQFKNIIIKTVERHADPPLRHRLRRGHDRAARRARCFLGDGSPAVQLDIRRASGENTIKVTDGVKQQLGTVRQALPKGASLVVTNDDSEFIYASVDVARGAPALGQPARLADRRVLHPQHPGRHHLRAGHPRLDHRDVHADARAWTSR